MRRILTGLGVLLLSLAAAGSVQAQHPLASGGCDTCEPARKISLWPFSGHKLFNHGCQDACSTGHKLWPFSGHKLFNHGCGHGLGHHCGHGGCGNHPWFNTFKGCPSPDTAFPLHPFARSPRDFFMYEW